MAVTDTDIDDPKVDDQQQDEGGGLPDDKKAELKSIVSKMMANKEPEDKIKSVVEYYGRKFGGSQLPSWNQKEINQSNPSESQPVSQPQIKTLPENLRSTADINADKLKAAQQAAKETIDAELLGNNDVATNVIKNQKYQNQTLQNSNQLANTPQSDAPLTPVQRLGQSLQPAQVPPSVTPDDINEFMQNMNDDKTGQMARGFLSNIIAAKPEKAKEIQQSVYLNDAVNRIGDDPNKEAKVLDNVKKLGTDDYSYNPQTQTLHKLEDMWQSIGTGTKEKQKAFADYDFFKNSTPQQSIDELNKRMSSFDPDEPIPMPASFMGQLTGGLASQPVRGMLAGKAAGGLTALIPGAEEASPAVNKFVTAAVSGLDFKKIAFSNLLQSNYADLKSKGLPDDQAYAQANKAAEEQSNIEGAGGMAMMYLAGKIGETPIPKFSLSEGYTNAVKSALVHGVKGIGEAGAVGLIQGQGQQAKNEIAQEQGITTDDSGKDIGTAIKDGILFTLGIAALAKGLEMPAKAKNVILQGLSKADPAKVNEEIGNQILETHITPQEGQQVKTDITAHTDLDSSIPENVDTESRLKIQDNIKKMNDLEEQKSKLHKDFQPEVQSKIDALSEQNAGLRKNTVKNGEEDILSKNDKDVPRETIQPQQQSEPDGAGKVQPIEITGTKIFEHGEDEKTAAGLENGTDSDSHLVPKGVEEAKSIGDYVSEKLPDVKQIVTSPVERGLETAQTVADRVKEVDPQRDLKVVENPNAATMDIGEFDGKKDSSFDERDWFENHFDEKVPGGESPKDFTERMEKLYKQVHDDYGNETQVITHSKVTRALKSLGETDGKWTDDTTKKFLALDDSENSKINNGDLVSSPHFEGARQVTRISDDGETATVSNPDRPHEHMEIPVKDIQNKSLNLPNDETSSAKGQNQSNGANLKVSPKEKTVSQRIAEIPEGTITDPYDKVLHYFSTDGKIHSSSMQELFGDSKGKSVETERRSRISLLGKNAPSIDRLAHNLWEEDTTGKYDTRDYKDAIENVLRDYNSKGKMGKDLIEKYDVDAAYEKYMQQHGKEFSDIYDNLSDADVNHILELDSKENSEKELNQYFDNLLKNKQDASAIRSDSGQVRPAGETPESGQNNSGQNLQPSQANPPINGEANQQTGQEVNQTESGDSEHNDVGGNTVGISHDRLSELAKKLGLSEPMRSKYVTPEEWADYGRQMISHGADPEKIASAFEKDKLVSPERNSVARAMLEDLTKEANAIGDKFGVDSKEYKEISDRLGKWASIAKEMGSRTGESMTSLQGERDIETGSFTALRNAAIEEKGKPLTRVETEHIKNLSDTVKKHQDEIERLTKELDKAHNEKTQTKETGKPQREKLSNQLNDIAKRLRTSSEFDDFLKGTDDLQKMGVDFPRLKEIAASILEDAAKAVKAGENAVDFIRDAVDKLKEDIDKGKLIDGLTAIGKKTGLFEIKETPEEKKIDRLQKELDDLQQGIVKKKSLPIEDTEEAKKIKEQIFEAKKNLGLIKSKQPIEKTEDIENDTKELAKRFATKIDNKFSPKDAKDIWTYAKKTYIDKGSSYESMLKHVADDLGLTNKQVREAIASPKSARVITDKMYREIQKRNDASAKAKQEVREMGNGLYAKYVKTLPSLFFKIKVFGHGTVGMITHAGSNIFRPSQWGAYWRNFGRQYKFFLGSDASYAKAMSDLKNDPMFTFFKRVGLAVDPKESYDDYQKYGSWWGKVGIRGERGFNALKTYRLDKAKMYWNNLSDMAKADPEMPKEIANIVNHETGTSELNLGKLDRAANVIAFAPKLEFARWQGLVTDPLKAIGTLLKGNKASDSEIASAKIIGKKAGEIIGTYALGLVANQGLLMATGSNSSVNFTNPRKGDWLKFKVGDDTIDVSGGMVSTIHFIASMFLAAEESKQDLMGKSRSDLMATDIWNYATGKLSPFLGTVKDFATQKDFSGNVMPFSNDKPRSGKEKLTWSQYIEDQQLPLPISEAFKATDESMKSKGMSNDDIEDIMNGIWMGLWTGGTGVKITQPQGMTKGGSGGGSGAGGSIPTLTQYK